MIADGSEPGITADCERAHVKEHRIPYTEAWGRRKIDSSQQGSV